MKDKISNKDHFTNNFKGFLAKQKKSWT